MEQKEALDGWSGPAALIPLGLRKDRNYSLLPASPLPSLCCWGWVTTHSWWCHDHQCSGSQRGWWSFGEGWSLGWGLRWPQAGNPQLCSLSGLQWWSWQLHQSLLRSSYQSRERGAIRDGLQEKGINMRGAKKSRLRNTKAAGLPNGNQFLLFL